MTFEIEVGWKLFILLFLVWLLILARITRAHEEKPRKNDEKTWPNRED